MNKYWAATTIWNGEEFGLIASEQGLVGVALPNEWPDERRLAYEMNQSQLRPYLDQFELYWAGQLQRWTIPLDLRGTPFQQAVWRELLNIPYGSVTTYGSIARQIGRPTAVRAVAAAVGRNPIAVVIPCHRVIGKDGTLTGYAGGLPLKQELLRLEGVDTVKPVGHARFAF